MQQLNFFETIQETSYDWKNHPKPEMVFGDLKIGDHFQVVTWVKDGWHVISEIFVRVEQPTVLYPNSIALERDKGYPYRLGKTSFFRDVPVILVKSA